MHWMRGLAVMVALHWAGAAPAVAQVRLTSLDDVRREVAPGDVISVVQTTGDRMRGEVLRFGEADLVIRALTPPAVGEPSRRLDISVPLSVLESLERPRDSSRNGALIGAGIGGGFALAMGAWALAVDRNEMDEWVGSCLVAGAVFSGIGAVAGWAIDRAHSKPHVRYEAPAGKATGIRVAPLVTGRAGMAVSFSFGGG